jgi:multicomponent Na+:H+ antiporter subunit E
MIGRAIALGIWSFAVWLVLTWMFTFEQLAFGAAAAVAVAVAIAPLGPVARPWLVTDPRRLFAGLRLARFVIAQMVAANLRLARRVWSPRLSLRSGMVIAPTAERSEGGLTAVGLLTSLIVENQLVDVDRRRHLLQYHAVTVPEGGAREAINGPIERLLAPIVGARGDAPDEPGPG